MNKKQLEVIKGAIEINGSTFKSISDVNLEGQVTIKFGRKVEVKKTETQDETEFRIKVRQYMTKPASAEFDFHDKMNNGVPMPMRVMVGVKLQETRGMVKMQLHGDITEEQSDVCMKCGRQIKDPVSKYFSMGPECSGHGYKNPFSTKEELLKAVDKYRQELKEITWTGWIIKSAIEEETPL